MRTKKEYGWFGTKARIALLVGAVVCFFLLLTGMRAQAASVVDNGTCGDNVRWSLDSDGKISLTGSGPMTDYRNYLSVPWSSYRTSINTVSVGSGITTIGNYAFCDCENLGVVSLPNSITRIGVCAFLGCNDMATLSLYSIETIGYGAFAQCVNLEEITLGSGVKHIGDKAFYECESLQSLSLENGIISIGEEAFYYCPRLTYVSIPNSVSEIGNWAFAYCYSLGFIAVGTGNQYYYADTNGCLYNRDKTMLIQYPIGNERTSFSIPSSVVRIGDNAFSGNESLTSVTIPNSVISIEPYAFWFCNGLTKVTIPASVKSIEVGAFGRCENLKKITVASGNKAFVADVDGCLYNKNKTTLIQYPIGNSGTAFSVPSSVKAISSYAFYYSQYLKSITIPNGVTSIGECAFARCAVLKSITLPKSVTSIGDEAFSYCNALTTVQIWNKNCDIGKNCFAKSASVTICAPSGSTAQTYAQNNNLNFSVLSNHSHTYGKVKVTKATTTKDGARTKTCTVCGKKVTVKIAKIKTIKLSKASYTYTGKAIAPTVVATDSNGKQLTKGTDYTVTYAKGRKACGIYAVKVTFTGNYSGSKTLSFKIIPAQVTGLKQQASPGIIIQWNKVKGASYYEIYGEIGGKFKQLGTANVNVFGSSAISKGTVMRVKVRAVAQGSDGTLYKGAFSKVLTATARG